MNFINFVNKNQQHKMTDTIKIALIQADLVWENKEENIKRFTQRISEVEKDVDLIVLPEMFTTGFSMHPENLAEQPSGKTFVWMQNQAKLTQKVIAGTVIITEDNKFYNRFLWVRPDGSFIKYDKRHAFSLAGEHEKYTVGTERIIVELKGWKIFLQTCYDLRFPVWSRNKKDYDVLINAANWPIVRSDAWKTLLPARAIENQCYVLAVNRCGPDNNGMNHSGNTAAYDYEGKQIGTTQEGQEETLHITLQKESFNKFRNKFTFLNDSDSFEIEVG